MLRTRRCVNWSSAQTLPDTALARRRDFPTERARTWLPDPPRRGRDVRLRRREAIDHRTRPPT